MGSGRQTEEGYTSGQLCAVMEVLAQQEELLVHQFPGMETSSSQHNHSHSHYQYAHVFPFEDRFDQRVAQGWVQEHWVSVCTWTGFIYVLLVFSGQAWMSSRPAYQLRNLLAAWSAFLAIFSIIGFLRVLPEFLHTLTYGGLYKSICDPSFIHSNKVSGYWTWLFTLSKMPELGDTVFIVLRKQQLIFLHWYHHLTVLIYVFYCFSQFTSCARWFMVMNYFVHSLMYSYYALRAMKVKVPRGVAMSITSLQLLQMVVGCVINYLAFQFKRSGFSTTLTLILPPEKPRRSWQTEFPRIILENLKMTSSSTRNARIKTPKNTLRRIPKKVLMTRRTILGKTRRRTRKILEMNLRKILPLRALRMTLKKITQMTQKTRRQKFAQLITETR